MKVALQAQVGGAVHAWHCVTHTFSCSSTHSRCRPAWRYPDLALAV